MACRKRKRDTEQKDEPPDTEMRQKLRHRNDDEQWPEPDANGISRSASAEFEPDPEAPAGKLQPVRRRLILPLTFMPQALCARSAEDLLFHSCRLLHQLLVQHALAANTAPAVLLLQLGVLSKDTANVPMAGSLGATEADAGQGWSDLLTSRA